MYSSLIRLNTVFKLYISNWILWAVASGYIVFQFRHSFSRKKTWGIVAVLLFLIASVYPVFATIGRSDGFKGTPGLDGEAYIRKEHPEEYEAIMWFRDLTANLWYFRLPEIYMHGIHILHDFRVFNLDHQYNCHHYDSTSKLYQPIIKIINIHCI